MRIEVTPEGRDGVWIPNKDSLVKFLENYNDKFIHSFITGPVMMGVDRSTESVIKDVGSADRLAILTGESFKGNMRHSLSVIKNKELEIFDIGEITENDLNILETVDEKQT